MTPMAQALSEALLQFVWQGFVVWLFLWAALFLLRKHSPNVRYLVSCAALALLAVFPVVTALALYDPVASNKIGSAAAITLTIRAVWPGTLSPIMPVAQVWMLRAWLLGVVYLSLRLAWTGAQISSLRRSGAPADADLLASANKLAQRMGVQRVVRVLISSLPDGPSVAGWIRPVIVLPVATILNLTPEQLESILAHELAHLRRYDDVFNIAQSVVETLLFYHPAVWWVSNRIRHERELCCDDLAVKVSGNAISYARALTALEKMRVSAPRLAIGATDAPLAYRIRRITGAHTQEYLPSGLPGAMALALALACFAGYSSQARGAAQSPRARVAYPEAARANGIQGTVPVEVRVDANGRVTEARAVGGPRELRNAAVESVAALHFTPGARQHINVAFQLAAADFAGRVVEDSSGEAVAAAELRIHKAGMRELVADLETDRTGRFAGTDLPAGDYTVDVSKPNFVTTAFPFHIPHADVQVRLLRYGVMDGKVANVRGEAIAGKVMAPGGQTVGATRITVLAKQSGSEVFRSFRNASLDENGHYRFFDLPPGQYELGIWYYGINEGAGMRLYPDNVNPRIFTVAGGEVYNNLNFLIAPEPQYEVSGTVALPDPKAKFALSLGKPEQPALPVAIAFTKEDGSFQFGKVPAGTYDLLASGPTGGYTEFESTLGKGTAYFARMRIQVSGPSTGLSVAVSEARSINVTLGAHGSEPFPASCPKNAAVTLTPLDPWGMAFFDARGQAVFSKEQTIKNLAPGRFRVTASDLGAGCYQVGEMVVDVSGDVPDPVVVEVAAAGSVQGTLGGADSVAVLLDAGQTQLAFPGADGHFSFSALHPGRYRIAASKSRWVTDVSRMKEIEVLGGKTTDVDLPTGGSQ